jgi:hypothetical protein
MSRTVHKDAVRFHHGSFADPNGRLFFWQDELYRAIKPAYAGVLERLDAGGLMDGLVGQGLLIESASTDLAMEGAVRVLKHRQLPFVTYPCEWSPSMFKDAALHVIDLEIALARQGLTVSDPHAWNVLFDWGRPRFVDVCGFALAGEDAAAKRGPLSWPGYPVFCRYLLNPLLAAQAGLERLARLSFLDLKGLAADDMGRMLGLRWRLSEMARHLPGGMARADRHGFLQLLRRYVEGIRPAIAEGHWSDYNRPAARVDPNQTNNSKIANVRQVIERLRPSSVLDVGANTGDFSRMALASGAAAVSIDTEVSCVDALHANARDENLRLIAAVIDIKNPTPGLGPVGAELPSCFDRLKCDMVLALAVTHHLAYRSLMTFDQMIDSFAAWSKRHLLVEYIPPDDVHVVSWNLQAKGWYDFDQFCAAINRHFVITEVLESYPSSRRLVVAEKRA